MNIIQNNKICNLHDAYRKCNPIDGYTWRRQNIYSRLDYTFVSSNLCNKIVASELDWAFDKSDHAAVRTSLFIPPDIKKGPGIIKVNIEILKDPVEK